MTTPSQVEYSVETDPLFKEISEEKKLKIDTAVKKKIQSLNLDDVVDVDSMTVPGQKYALISIVSPNGTQKSDRVCLKIKGVFDNMENANKHAEMLQKMDSTFDIYVVDMYSWLLVPPDPELIEQKHVDEKLNEILSGHRESQLKAKMHFEERKRELLEDVTIDDSTESEPVTESEPAKETVSVPVPPPTSPSDPNCPNSAPISEPSQLMESMIIDDKNISPKKTWADECD